MKGLGYTFVKVSRLRKNFDDLVLVTRATAMMQRMTGDRCKVVWTDHDTYEIQRKISDTRTVKA